MSDSLFSNSNESRSGSNNELIQRINFYYPIVLSSISTIANTVSFVVFSSRAFKNNASVLYLRVKAVVDVLNVYIGTLRFTYASLANGVNLKDESAFFCYFLSIGVYTIDPWTSWIGVFTSLDRLVLVLKPTFYQSIRQSILKRFQISLVCLTFVVILGINLLKLSFVSFVDQKNTTDSYNQTISVSNCFVSNPVTVDWLNLSISLLVPFLLMSSTSIFLSYSLIKSKSNSKKENKQVGKSKNIAFIETIICLDVGFLLFNLPRFLTQILSHGTSDDNFVLVIQIAAIIKYSYYSITALIYFTFNHLFRRILCHSLCKLFLGIALFCKNFYYLILILNFKYYSLIFFQGRDIKIQQPERRLTYLASTENNL